MHRSSGMVFVCSMVTMSLSAALIAASMGVRSQVLTGTMTAYFVITGLTAVRPPALRPHLLNGAATMVGLAVGICCLVVGIDLLVTGELDPGSLPAPMALAFGAITVGAGASDLRVIRAGSLRGPHRIARHLWRMCFALWIACGSFFLGQADEIPEPFHVPVLLPLPMLTVLAVMAYWLWRLRRKRPVPVLIRPTSCAAEPTVETA